MVRLQFGEWLVVNCSDQRADLPGWLLAAGQPGHCTKHVTCVTNVRQCMLLMSTIKLQCNFPILTFVKKKPANYCISPPVSSLLIFFNKVKMQILYYVMYFTITLYCYIFYECRQLEVSVRSQKTVRTEVTVISRIPADFRLRMLRIVMRMRK